MRRNLHDAAVPRPQHDATEQIGARRSAVVIDETLLERFSSLFDRGTGSDLLDGRCKAGRRQAFHGKRARGGADGEQPISPEARVEDEGNADRGNSSPKRAAKRLS